MQTCEGDVVFHTISHNDFTKSSHFGLGVETVCLEDVAQRVEVGGIKTLDKGAHLVCFCVRLEMTLLTLIGRKSLFHKHFHEIFIRASCHALLLFPESSFVSD